MVTPDHSKNRRVAFAALLVAVAMVGLSFASVPLYRLFCQKTGFGGTTQRAEAAPLETSSKTVTIRFDANVAESLGWKFKPGQLEMTVKLGEQALAHYTATNLTAETRTGQAIFNVTPENAGIYFNKIECFCFTEQKLAAGQTEDMPVSFYVDPGILKDPETQSIDTITLSYTFFPADKPRSVSQAVKPAVTTAN